MMRLQRIAASAACALLLAYPAIGQVIGSGHVLGNGTASPASPTDTPLLQILNQSGSGLSLAGNTSTLATVSGVIANGHCRSTDANGNEIDAGGACTTGGGGGTVTAALGGQTAYYPSNGSTVAGEAPGAQSYTQSTGGTATARTFQTKFDDWISAKDYGAVGNGTADDTTAINTWLAAVTSQHVCGYLPAGTYKVTAALTPITVGGWCIHGAGQFVSTINYAGATTTSIILSVACSSGAGVCNNISLSDFQITSATAMSSNSAGIQFNFSQFVTMRNIGLSNYQSGNQNLYKGVIFSNSSWITWIGGDVYTSFYDIEAYSGVELSLDQMHFIHPGDTAIHLGGGFGGLYTGYVSVFGGAVGLRVDTGDVAAGNNQIFISNRTAFDNQTAAGVYLSDSLASNKSLSFDGWASSCVNSGCSGLTVVGWATGNIEIGGGAQFLSNNGNGLYLSDNTATYDIDTSVMIRSNAQYGIFCNGTIGFIQSAGHIAGNTSGNMSGNCHGTKASVTAF